MPAKIGTAEIVSSNQSARIDGLGNFFLGD
jgi:hypothetical protein